MAFPNKPGEAGRRDPTSNKQQNGRITNPPRYAEMGGYTSGRKGISANDKRIVLPGPSVK
jgi:hypothetical protein